MRKISDKRKDSDTDAMVRGTPKHANPERRNQRSVNTHAFDPRTDSKTKRRRTGATNPNWDSLMMKWSGCQRWWVPDKEWDSFVPADDRICKRTLKKDKKREGKSSGRTIKDEESGKKKKKVQQERGRLRRWDARWCSRTG